MTYVIGQKARKLNWLQDRFPKPWLSRKYEKNGVIYSDLKCDICGKWYTYSNKDIPQIRLEHRWNFKTNRPYHCGNGLCQDYHQREQKHLWKMATEIARQCFPYAEMQKKRI